MGGFFLDLFSSFVRVCVLFRKARRQRLSEDGIKVSRPSPRSGDASSIIGRRVEVCLRRISRDSVGVCLRWIHVDYVFVRLCSCVYRLDPSDLNFSLIAASVVLVHRFYRVLARRLPDYLLFSKRGVRPGLCIRKMHMSMIINKQKVQQKSPSLEQRNTKKAHEELSSK